MLVLIFTSITFHQSILTAPVKSIFTGWRFYTLYFKSFQGLIKDPLSGLWQLLTTKNLFKKTFFDMRIRLEGKPYKFNSKIHRSQVAVFNQICIWPEYWCGYYNKNFKLKFLAWERGSGRKILKAVNLGDFDQGVPF